MDTRDGYIYGAQDVNAVTEEARKFMISMGHHPTPFQRAARKVGRNDACPCGSRKKFKKCCLWKP